MPTIRDRIFLATKTGDRRADDAYASIVRSLERSGSTAWTCSSSTRSATRGPRCGHRSRGAVEGAARAKDESLVAAIGITGHGMQAPAVHPEALRRFPFDTVLTPFNHRLAREPAYPRDFDAGGGRPSARRRARGDQGRRSEPVARGRDPRYATWYEPLDEQAHIDAAVAFALARPEVTGIATAGDVRLLPMFVEAERRRGSPEAPGSTRSSGVRPSSSPPSCGSRDGSSLTGSAPAAGVVTGRTMGYGRPREGRPWRLIQTNLREIDMRDIDAARYVEELRAFDATVAMINTSGIIELPHPAESILPARSCRGTAPRRSSRRATRRTSA